MCVCLGIKAPDVYLLLPSAFPCFTLQQGKVQGGNSHFTFCVLAFYFGDVFPLLLSLSSEVSGVSLAQTHSESCVAIK